MASRAIDTGGASAPLDLAAILSALPSLPRPILSRLTARMIDRMDEIDGDPDLEAAHDEDAPYFPRQRRLRNSQRKRADPLGPGCQISDPKDTGQGEDESY